MALAESPVHHDTYYQVVADLPRQRQVQLDRELLSSEIAHTLASGAGIPISHSEARLYGRGLEAGTPVAGREVRTLGLDEMNVLIVGIVRGEHDMIPHGGTVLQVGDNLLVTATRDSIVAFSDMIAVPAHRGEKPADGQEDPHLAAG
jgi:Trk K+ transport system NAD-binding subunit